MVARYEPEGDAPPNAEAEPLLGRPDEPDEPDERAASSFMDKRDERDERAASSSIGPIGPTGARRRTGRLPVVAVDRLEDLDGPGASAFRADAWAVHPEREPEQ